MSTAIASPKTRVHDRVTLHDKWDVIHQELLAESEAAAKRRDSKNPSNFQIRRFALCVKKLFEAASLMPMLAHRLCDDPDTFAYYERGLERIRRSLGHISLDRLVSDRVYAKQKNAQLRRVKKAISDFGPQICQTGDDLRWIATIYG